jgi:hypothetical protein
MSGPPDVAFRDNRGRMPREAAGKRVQVRLRNGFCPPASWPADGRDGCNWAFTPEGKPSRDFDIMAWEIVE